MSFKAEQVPLGAVPHAHAVYLGRAAACKRSFCEPSSLVGLVYWYAKAYLRSRRSHSRALAISDSLSMNQKGRSRPCPCSVQHCRRRRAPRRLKRACCFPKAPLNGPDAVPYAMFDNGRDGCLQDSLLVAAYGLEVDRCTAVTPRLKPGTSQARHMARYVRSRASEAGFRGPGQDILVQQLQ